FDERMGKRPAAFSEGNWLLPSGAAQLPWAAVRESPSEVLPFLHELEALPVKPLAAGTRRDRFGQLGPPPPVAAAEKLDGVPGRDTEECLRIEGANAGLSLRLWFCPASGTMARLELDGEYSSPPDRRVRERVRLRLEERRRGEELERWLAAKDANKAALAALFVSESPLPAAASAERLAALLDTEEDGLLRPALAVLFRHRLAPPSVARLAALFARADPRIRALVVRLLETIPAAPARPLVERALEDSDVFVEDAAVQWVANRTATGPRPRTPAAARA